MNYDTLLGTVSHGTLRTQDLIDAAIDAFDRLKDWRATAGKPYDEPDEVRAVSQAEDMFAQHEHMRSMFDPLNPDTGGTVAGFATYEDWCEAEEGTWRLEELTGWIEHLCPDGVYYGATKGDGADIGFWLDWYVGEGEEDENVVDD